MPRVVVIGAGIGGLVAAVDLARAGVEVTVIERSAEVGGKIREVTVGDARIDSGPTVFTMKRVFDELFDDARDRFDARVRTRSAATLARHVWSDGTRLDLHADLERSVDAIAAAFGPQQGRRYRAFAGRAERIATALEPTFMRTPCPSPVGLARRFGFARWRTLLELAPFTPLWSALARSFDDRRLRQLFARYATYQGSSPFAAPATLMLIAHIEREGVWTVDDGMHAIPRAVADLATRLGASVRTGVGVREILVRDGRACGVLLDDETRLDACAVVSNADAAALATGVLGREAAVQARVRRATQRSLSAITWSLRGRTSGVSLSRHTVFFSDDYAAEFRDLDVAQRAPRAPTVYVCAQDRGADEGGASLGAERLFCLVNAPANGDTHQWTATESESCQRIAFGHLARCGLTIENAPAPVVTTTPSEFARMYPATGGALYGAATHGWSASFRRPGARTRLPGLILAGGSAHPGAGVPMAALSGRIAAAAVLEDLHSTSRSRATAMPGGTSTRSPTTAGTDSR